MTRSMTGYATVRGQTADWSWVWDLRSVNGRGLDLRLRLPDWIEGLEPAARAALQAEISRGSVTLSLKLTRSEGAGTATLDRAALRRTVVILREIEDLAAENELAVRHATAAEIAALPGVLSAPADEVDAGALRTAVLADLDRLIAAFHASREAEGAALAKVIGAQIDRIEALTAQAADSAEARAEAQRAALTAALARILDAAEGVDEGRIAQELALLAVKSDVTEELDRLRAHVGAARALVTGQGPRGRKLDFLMQEFNREANTLCSKAGSAALTAIGLDLKTVIDQMREQVQNVE
ncbi:YicC/YloC family endoribonuclease [Palleronia sp. KMU-117]|uniref:YicC/YloC family endoribonuclease n=1 Tax=Palleronia sp. KMU-117 TaxID=3434108 RepID=UPI003D762BAC